jgi:hypothetical protein
VSDTPSDEDAPVPGPVAVKLGAESPDGVMMFGAPAGSDADAAGGFVPDATRGFVSREATVAQAASATATVPTVTMPATYGND